MCVCLLESVFIYKEQNVCVVSTVSSLAGKTSALVSSALRFTLFIVMIAPFTLRDKHHSPINSYTKSFTATKLYQVEFHVPIESARNNRK